MRGTDYGGRWEGAVEMATAMAAGQGRRRGRAGQRAKSHDEPPPGHIFSRPMRAPAWNRARRADSKGQPPATLSSIIPDRSNLGFCAHGEWPSPTHASLSSHAWPADSVMPSSRGQTIGGRICDVRRRVHAGPSHCCALLARVERRAVLAAGFLAIHDRVPTHDGKTTPQQPG